MTDLASMDARGLLERHQAALLELARFEGLQSDDRDLALRILVDVAARTLNVERSSIWVFDEERTKITCVMLFERSSRQFTTGAELRAVDVPSYFAALNENRALASDDVLTDPAMVELVPIYLEPLGIVSMLDAPIRLGGRIAGIVCNEHTGLQRTWTLEERNFAASISDMAAITLEHSDRVRAEAEIRRRDEMLDGVARAANRMFSNAERDLAYQEGLLRAIADVAQRTVQRSVASANVLALIGGALLADAVGIYFHAGTLTSAAELGARDVWTVDGSERVLLLDTESALPEPWLEALNGGSPIGGPVDGPASARSVLLAPVAGKSGLKGVIEVDAETSDREWTRSEEQFLRACGLLLGSV